MFYLIIILSIALVILRLPSVKGYFGEHSVQTYLNKLDKEKYRVFHNVLIQSPNGNMSQIDHLVVSVYGVFVIETKNYKGWILGSEKSQYWTQVIYRYKERFYNPILQNKSHIQALKNLLWEFKQIPWHSIIVFTTRATLKTGAVPNLIYNFQLPKIIEKYQEQVISHNDVNRICDIIKNSKINDKSANKKHIESIKNIRREWKEKVTYGICPRCGCMLVDREGKHGWFKGCSNYPKCKFTYKGTIKDNTKNVRL